MNADDFDDYWVQSPKTVQAPAKPALQIDTIDGVAPLDAQLGVAELKTVPDALYEPLFGQPTDVALHTYAILDAAKVPNLPELLEVSGLAHRCLFKGDAYDELKDVAPWIVQLEDENAFSRNLFTRSDAPWHLWDNEPGIYLRSSASLADLCAHFRRFTKVQQADGRWRYFRFWEPLVLQAYITAKSNRSEQRCPLFHGSDGITVASYVCCPVPGHVTVHALLQNGVFPEGTMGPKFVSADERAIAVAMQRRRQLEVGSALRKSFADEASDLTENDLTNLVGRVVQKMGRHQVRAVRHIHTFAAWQLIYGEGFECRDPDRYIQQVLDSSLSEEHKMARVKDRLDDLHQAGLL